MLTTSFGHGDILIWFMEIFFFVVWFWLLMSVVSDLFRYHEASGVTKALWIVLVLIFPVFGILAYMILRGGGMAARAARQQQEVRDREQRLAREVVKDSKTQVLSKRVYIGGRGIM